jgi:PilZ domain
MKPKRDGFVFRTYSRFPLRTPMIYMGQEFAGQGVLRELSRVGCSILGNFPVTLGETLSLRLSHPTHPDPLLIKQAGVRWVRGFEFGVAFAPSDKGEIDRLHQMLDDFLDSWTYSEVPSPL